jgi:uncharacterized LabA/DUF88 family protein
MPLSLMNNADRIIIFIDGSNFYHILKDMFRNHKTLMDFNFEEFVKYLASGRKLIRTYYYSAPLDKKKDEETYSKQQKFFEKIKKLPDFELILCRMQKDRIDGEITYSVKEDDIHIAVDMVKLAYNDAYDTAILISTDGDFVPAIDAVKEKGKKVENIGFETKFSWHLKQKSDRFRQITKKELILFFN